MKLVPLCALVLSAGTVFADLPIGFQEIEYVKSTGDQSVDTGYVVTRDTKVVADYAFTSVPSSGNVTLFGWAGGAGVLLGLKDGKLSATFVSAYGSAVVTEIVPDKNRHQVSLQNGRLTYDGTDYALAEAPAPFVVCQPGTMAIFSRHYAWESSGESGYTWKSKAKLYGLKIYDGATLRRDYVPCVRRSDCAVGLYDCVTGTFAGSLTSTALVASPDGLVGCHELEYVESDGSAFVNTGVVAAKDLKSKVDYQLTAAISSSKSVIGWTGKSAYFFGHSASQIMYAFMSSGYTATDKLNYAADVERHTVEIENGRCALDGETLWTTQATSEFSNNPDGTIALMARHKNDKSTEGTDEYNWKTKMKLYACQMTLGSSPVRDYVPAQRLSDGVVGLYDRVNGAFTEPTGGTLIAGPVVGAAVVRPLAVAEVQQDDRLVPTGVTVTYGMDAAAARRLYLEYGRLTADRTSLVSPTKIVLALVPAGTDSLTVAFPAAVQDYFARRTGGFRVSLGSNAAASEGIPLEFEPVEYVQAAGGEYIETDVQATKDLRVTVDFQLTETPTGSVAIYGWIGSCAHFFGANKTYFRYSFLTNGYSSVENIGKTTLPLDTERHVVSIRNGMQVADLKKFATDEAQEEFDQFRKPGTITLLARHYNWDATTGSAKKAGYDWMVKAKLYSCQMENQGALVRDYAPCVRLSDGKAGVVNRLDGSFLPVVGSGATVGERLVSYETTAVIAGPEHGMVLLIR